MVAEFGLLLTLFGWFVGDFELGEGVEGDDEADWGEGGVPENHALEDEPGEGESDADGEEEDFAGFFEPERDSVGEEDKGERDDDGDVDAECGWRGAEEEGIDCGGCEELNR